MGDLSELAARACCDVVGDVFVHAIPEKLMSEQLIGLITTMISHVRIIIVQVLELLPDSRVSWYVKNSTLKNVVSSVKELEFQDIGRCLDLLLEFLAEGILVLEPCDEFMQGR